MMSYSIHTVEDTEDITIEDIIGEASGGPYHSILEVWREVLRGADVEREKEVSIQWALRVIEKYHGLGYADMHLFKDEYFGCVQDIFDALDAEIESDPECLSVMDAQEDRERNTHHYVNVIVEWQKIILTRELEWRADRPSAAVEVAVLGSIHTMLFAQEALSSLLDQINMEFTEEHSALLVEELEAIKASMEGR